MTAGGRAERRGERSVGRDVISRALELKPLGDNTFEAAHARPELGRVFGGEVMGQALAAAYRTVAASHFAHSMHTSFLRPGDARLATRYVVDVRRDGRSFSSRAVTAIQDGVPIVHVVASFTQAEDGFEYQGPVLDATPADELPPAAEAMAAAGDENAAWFDKISANFGLEFRFDGELPRFATLRGERGEPRQQIWMRVLDPLPDELPIHQGALAFASDILLLSSSLPPHGRVVGDPELQFASLDHAIWFHLPIRLDGWFHYRQHTPRTANGRALCHGEIFTPDGTLAATVTQEALIRVKKSNRK